MRVSLFVDVSNLYYTIMNIYGGRKLSYRRYLEACTRYDQDQLIRAVAYGASLLGNADCFIEVLKSLGFETKYKEVKRFIKKDKEFRKADWDVGIAVDIVRHVLETKHSRLDRIIIGSGDGDLCPVVEWVKEQGIEAHVFACNISKELRLTATSHQEIGPYLLEKPSGEIIKV